MVCGGIGEVKMSQRVKNGDKAEAVFLNYAVRNEWNICIPFTHDTPYDFIVEYENDLTRVQVKKAYSATDKGKKVIDCELRRTANNGKKSSYSINDFDYLAAVHIETNRLWFIPVEKCISHTRLRLNAKKWDKYKAG